MVVLREIEEAISISLLEVIEITFQFSGNLGELKG